MSRAAPPADPTPNGTEPVVENSPASVPSSASSPRGGQAEPSATLPTSAAPPTPATPPSEISDEAIAKWADGKSDDEIAKHPAMQKRFNQAVSRHIEKLNKENTQKQEQAQAYVNWDAYFKRLEGDPSMLVAALNHPDTGDRDTQAYAAIKSWRRSGGLNAGGAVSRESVADDMTRGLINYLKSDEKWSDLDDATVDEILSEKDVTKVLSRLLDAGTVKERRSIIAKAEAEADARYNELLAKRNLNANEPEPPSGAVIGTGSGLTLEQYNAMSSKDRRALPRAAIDAMFTEIQEAPSAGAG